MSHLTRGAWIEIFEEAENIIMAESRTSHEVRGLKSAYGWDVDMIKKCRTSHEVRGLKCGLQRLYNQKQDVAPHTRCVD